ncbi:MAG: hypothetical protein AABZ34_09635 [Nitrospirota bacterium]
MSKFVSVFVILFIAGCGSPSQWNDMDKVSVTSFIRSIALVTKAHSVSNARGPGVVSKSQMQEMMRLYEEAYQLSRKTTDESLAKANPELPKHYSLYFREGLRLRLEAWNTGKNYSEIQGSSLLDSWADWYGKAEIHIPKKMVIASP